MDKLGLEFWAKTTKDGQPGISVRDHCLNVGAVAEALIAALPPAVRALLPPGAVTLAALHDVGKITLGFQAKCPQWLAQDGGLPLASPGAIALSVSDHALVSQFFLQRILAAPARLWAVAVGAHHGRPKGRTARLNGPEAIAEWAEGHRGIVAGELRSCFGPLPASPPDPRLAPLHSDLWLLAGLISVADWIGSNEAWFPAERGLDPEAARRQAQLALATIGWPGSGLEGTDFRTAFRDQHGAGFDANPVQQAVAEAAQAPGIVIVEGPMGCGKTEAALFAAQAHIAAGRHQGLYFALPTQVTSNRIHRRVERFLQNTLAGEAPLRLAHGNAWLEDDFDLRLRPAFASPNPTESDDPSASVREARSWFASAKQALLATYGVGTVDQALQGVVAVRHFFVRRFALAGKVVILDEIHSYDLYTGTLVTALIRELINLRCSVIILSATLTAGRRRELLAAAGVHETTVPTAYPLVTSGSVHFNGGGCHHVAPEWPVHQRISLRATLIPMDEAVAELIRRAASGQHVLWIRNTVLEAQEAFRVVSGSICEGSAPVGLLHSRFPFHRRAELEDDWLERLGRDRPADGPGSVLIATQVVEQSVDIDLDFIVSDLAPTDMLLQRMGRLWRHERPQRRASAPEFWVRLPELPQEASAAELRKSLGRSARVYAPYVLLRTMHIWRPRTAIHLPADIRPLLEATYEQPGEGEPEPWKGLRADLEQEKAALAANAEAATRVLGNPMLADKDEVLTRRPGAPTKSVVLLRAIIPGSHGRTTLVALDGSTLELCEGEWRRAAARFLLHWIVRVPRWMVPADAPKPRWLALHAPPDAVLAVVREDGHCAFADTSSPMTYDPRLGIVAASAPQLTPQIWKDDADEFDS